MVVGVLSYASNLARRLRSGGSTLDDDLKRITDAGVVDIPKELFTSIIQESREEQSRKKIMNHLRQCLTDVSKPKDWKRAYNAMVLAEELMQNGSHALVAETAVGRHFDLVQRLSFFEHFELRSNEPAQKLIRTKAKALRSIVVLKIKAFSGKFKTLGREDVTDEASTCTPKGSVCTSFYSESPTLTSQIPSYDFEDLLSWAESDPSNPAEDAWYL